MSQQSPLRKEQLLDVLKDNFVVSINTYVSATKAAMRAEKPETAAEIFQSAVGFLSQEIPDPTSATTAAVTPPLTAASAASISRPLKDVRQRNNFSAASAADQNPPNIDVKLLPGGRLVLADFNNVCIKLFNTQGQHLHTLKCEINPFRLALIDSSETSSCFTLAVTLNLIRCIDILEVVNNQMMVKRTLQTSRQYCAVAAVNKTTLAMGYVSDPGIDLIDMAGQVLRQICSSVRPRYMDVTEDGEMICSTNNNRIARVQVDSGTVDFNQSVPQIPCPHGVAIASDGSVLVTGGSNKTLHMLSSRGSLIKQLWSVPSGRDQQGELWSVSMDVNICVCITLNGSVYLLDCVY
ncbi:hypothetical protein PoB_002449900 [Plakobranchus ocellatus]|uniref:NHL repeat protein n=1 Tax=Plakobranchus ocellatus TaxID=259542 RepID=A0AAV3ZRP0_9GAST|nr:hypothetical protein PoB_002449900 [Plakobranchus ocellatus]